jgi:hypothetical protein
MPRRCGSGVTATALQLLLQLLQRFEAKDVEGVVELFATDGVFADPHYPPPIGPSMAGHNAIRDGVSWGLGVVEQPHFDVRHQLSGIGTNTLAAVEVDTNHQLFGGAVLAFTQVFVAETNEDGRLRRLESYTPYPPSSLP